MVKHVNPLEWKFVYEHRSTLTERENRTRMEAESDRVSDRIVNRRTRYPRILHSEGRARSDRIRSVASG